MTWHIGRGEDLLLYPYWQRVGGRLWREVATIRRGAKRRFIDGVIVLGGPPVEGHGTVPWDDDVDIVVIEAKDTLRPSVIGQVAAARVYAEQCGAKSVRAVALVRYARDAELVEVCGELDIDVVDDVKRADVICSVIQPSDPLLHQLDVFAADEGLSGRAEALVEAARRGLSTS